LRARTAKDSIRSVASQELHNSYRLQSEAFMEGRMVVSAHISYSHTFAGSYLATTSGLTTVVSKPGPNLLSKLRRAIEAYLSQANDKIFGVGAEKNNLNRNWESFPIDTYSKFSTSGKSFDKNEMLILAKLHALNKEILSDEGEQKAKLELERLNAEKSLRDIEREKLFPNSKYSASPDSTVQNIDMIV